MKIPVLLGSLAIWIGIATAGCSSGGGGGAHPCADGGTCPVGQICGSQGFCVPQPSGGSGGADGGLGGGGASGGFGGTGGSFGGTGGTGGGFGGTGGSFGGTGGGFGGTGGGEACTDVGECPNTSTQVCDPATGTCVAGQCSDALDCPSGKMCVAQVDNATYGACYATCSPTGSPCANGATCRITNYVGSEGFCQNAGSGTEGQSCSAQSLNTSCVKDYLCASDNGTPVCRKQCDFWSSSPGCPGGQHCALSFVCFMESSSESAAIGQACSFAATGGEPCGSDGLVWRGLCVDAGSGMVCTKICRTNASADCPSGQSCIAFPTAPEIGACI
jgi:hypothetical protein